MLERLGHRADIVADGQAAVDAWQTGRYDLILMDCQMPVMDGYESTQRIRSLEQDGQRIPIIALTAHAMKGADAECIAAGMDDYLSKPVDREKLVKCLERWLPTSDGTETQISNSYPTGMPSTLSSDAPADWNALLVTLDQDERLARELAELFIDSATGGSRALAVALEAGDYGAISAKAHELKSACANMQALDAMTAAGRLEMAARNADTVQIPELVAALTRELDRMIDFLKQRVA